MSKRQTPNKVANINDRPNLEGVTTKQMKVMFNSVVETLKRRGMFGRLGKQYGDKRNLYDVLGYNLKPTVEDYWGMYLRQDVAKRIINAPAQSTWRKPPEVCENDSPNETTKFEQAFIDLEKQMKVWHYIGRVDRLAGLGYYGILLLGVPGELDTPVGKASQLLFLATYSQRHVAVQSFDSNPQSPRFGKPEYYSIDVSGDLAGLREIKASRTAKTNWRKVHFSRVIHVAENLIEDEVNGTPRLECVVNRLFDLEKTVGGSAEMYWRGAYGGFSLETKDDTASAFADSGSIDTDMIDDYAHGMRRWIDLQGYTVNQLQGQDVKPKELFDTIMALISGATGIPVRILLGSERGELASSQDESNWNSQIEDRRVQFAGPVVCEFVDKMITWGLLPKPKTGYELKWPPLTTATPMEEAELFSKIADGISKIAPVGAPEMIISPAEIRTKFLKLPAEQSTSTNAGTAGDDTYIEPMPPADLTQQ